MKIVIFNLKPKMKGYRTSSLLSTNQQEIKAAILILETNKKEGEEFIYYQFKTNDQSTDLIQLKGVILASVGISHGVLGNDYEIMIVEDITTKSKIIESQVKLKSSLNESQVSKKLDYQAKFKICSKSYLKNFLVSVIFPAAMPDNCVKFVCHELIESVSCFFDNFEADEVKRHFTDVIYKFCENLVYNTLIYSIPLEKEDFRSSPILYNPLCSITYNYNCLFPCFMIKPPLSDITKSELIEIVNTINQDRSVIQETLTLMDPPIFLRGCVLCFKDYVVYNSLTNSEFECLYRLSNIYDIHSRSCSSPEVLIIEHLYINNSVSFNDNEEEENEEQSNVNINNTKLNANQLTKKDTLLGNNKLRKTILATILAQRDFVLYCYLDILNTKMNSSFDLLYHKRAEDLLLGLLKRSYQNNLNTELSSQGISLNETFKSLKTNSNTGNSNNNNTSIINQPKYPNFDASSSKQVNKLNNNKKPYSTQNNKAFIASRINGIIESETKVNIIHYSIYNDSERVINTCDLNIDPITLQEVYRVIFNQYAIIQSNINKLNQRNKKLRVSEAFGNNWSCNYYLTTLKLDNKNKMKIIKENFLREVFDLKPFEFGVKLKLTSMPNIWVCCKIYEHSNLNGEFTSEQFSNYKIIFLAYESDNMVDIDNFCQDLIINSLFI